MVKTAHASVGTQGPPHITSTRTARPETITPTKGDHGIGPLTQDNLQSPVARSPGDQTRPARPGLENTQEKRHSPRATQWPRSCRTGPRSLQAVSAWITNTGSGVIKQTMDPRPRNTDNSETALPFSLRKSRSARASSPKMYPKSQRNV
jgi:hypothetical protein